MSRIPRVVTILSLSMGLTSAAHAQGIARNFDELRLLVRPGDRVTVRDASGASESGRVTRLSPEALTLAVNGAERELAERDVSSILQRRQDPLGNGARWGLGVAAGLVALTAASVKCDGCGGLFVFGGLFYGGLGAGIGVGVDALITRPAVVYEHPGAEARVRVAPIAGRGRAGVALNVAF